MNRNKEHIGSIITTYSIIIIINIIYTMLKEEKKINNRTMNKKTILYNKEEVKIIH